MFCLSFKEKKLKPLQYYKPRTEAEQIAINVVSRHGMYLAGGPDLINTYYYKSGDFVFRVPPTKMLGVEFRWTQNPVIFNAEDSVGLEDISDECFAHLLYLKDNLPKSSSLWKEELLKNIKREYL